MERERFIQLTMLSPDLSADEDGLLSSFQEVRAGQGVSAV